MAIYLCFQTIYRNSTEIHLVKREIKEKKKTGLTRLISLDSIHSRLFIKDHLYITIHFDLLLFMKIYVRKTHIKFIY